MKDGFNEALIKEGFMHDIHMQVGFNNTVYCVQCSESQSGAEVVEFFVQPDGSWRRKEIYQVTTDRVIAFELYPRGEMMNQHLTNKKYGWIEQVS